MRIRLRTHTLIVLALVALLTTGASSCEPQLVEPKGGHVVVDHVLSPVRVHATRLEGGGRLEALLPTGDWSLLQFTPGGTFIFDERLPFEAWYCTNPGTAGGCVARLKIGHDGAPIGPNRLFETGIIHVCTANYIQREGRRHCGVRDLEQADGAFAWIGDPWSRLVVGAHEFKHAAADSPPTGDQALELSGSFFDYQWTPRSGAFSRDLGAPPVGEWQAYAMDLGACSFFIPWEWEHRLTEAYYTAGLGTALQNRGLAERFIDEMVDTTEPRYQTEVNALLWIDGTAGIIPNESASPEFHYRLSEATGAPQFCFKQYFHASSGISAKPDHWYRFDQAVGAFFLELLPFIGECGYKNLSIRYCGTSEIKNGAGAFEIDQSSVRIEHQGYPWGKVLCNNRFVPELVDGIRATFAPGGEGAEQIDAGMAVLVDTLSDKLGLGVRRIEISPRGMYLITAENTLDSQYGLGDCRADLDRDPPFPTASRSSETYIEYQTRGVTRF